MIVCRQRGLNALSECHLAWHIFKSHFWQYADIIRCRLAGFQCQSLLDQRLFIIIAERRIQGCQSSVLISDQARRFLGIGRQRQADAVRIINQIFTNQILYPIWLLGFLFEPC